MDTLFHSVRLSKNPICFSVWNGAQEPPPMGIATSKYGPEELLRANDDTGVISRTFVILHSGVRERKPLGAVLHTPVLEYRAGIQGYVIHLVLLASAEHGDVSRLDVNLTAWVMEAEQVRRDLGNGILVVRYMSECVTELGSLVSRMNV